MRVRITDRKGVSYDERPGRTVSLPFQWIGQLPKGVADVMIKAGAAEALEEEKAADKKASEGLEHAADKELLKKINKLGRKNQESAQTIASLEKQLTEEKQLGRQTEGTLNRFMKFAGVLRGFCITFAGLDEKLIDDLLEAPEDHELVQQIVDKVVVPDEAIPEGIKPAATATDGEPPELTDRQKELLAKYKKFGRKALEDMLNADKIDYAEKANAAELAEILARARGA